MAITGENLLAGFSKFIDDWWESDTTAAGSTTTIVDTILQRHADDGWNDFYARINETGHSAIYEVRRVSDFVNSTGTLTVAPAFSATTGSAKSYQLHKFDPADKFEALERARISVYPYLGKLVFDDTLTGDGLTRSFDVPSTIRRGPTFILVESPIPANQSWNFIQDPRQDATTYYTASSATVATYARNEKDRVIPKYDDNCLRVDVATTTNGTVTQTISNMTNGASATEAAGRHMSFASWVYCLTASRITLKIIDDTGTVATSSAHGGAGWELLSVEGDISETNATNLSVRWDCSNAAGAVTFFINRGWFYYGTPERVTNVYAGAKARRLRRDATTQKVYFNFPPERGYQLRFIGRDTLSSLGATATLQATNSMEVDEESAQLLYAEAAKNLFSRYGLSTQDIPELASRIQLAERQRNELRTRWQSGFPNARAVVGPWAS